MQKKPTKKLSREGLCQEENSFKSPQSVPEILYTLRTPLGFHKLYMTPPGKQGKGSPIFYPNRLFFLFPWAEYLLLIFKPKVALSGLWINSLKKKIFRSVFMTNLPAGSQGPATALGKPPGYLHLSWRLLLGWGSGLWRSCQQALHPLKVFLALVGVQWSQTKLSFWKCISHHLLY